MTARRRIDVHQHLVPPRYALDVYAALGVAGHSAIDRGNAAALFGEDA